MLILRRGDPDNENRKALGQKIATHSCKMAKKRLNMNEFIKTRAQKHTKKDKTNPIA
jgi:hypothetical protein